MNRKTRLLLIGLIAGLSLILAACGGGGAPAGGGAAPAGGTVLEIGSDGENLAFNKTTLSAKAGEPVTVKMKNNSTAQQHNWILVKGGEDVATKVNDAGVTAGADKGYIAEGADVVAHTKLLNAGETGEVTFTAPGPGTYTFICSVPGHYPLMKGTFTVN